VKLAVLGQPETNPGRIGDEPWAVRKECVVTTNPFEDPDAKYFVLINDEGQHSLWPVFADVPDGWEIIFGEDGRQECLDFIEKNWTDMRPKSLIKAMEEDAAGKI
jgi:MbtH protein